ncbi:hypothetical protein BDR26DRAFT_849395 [Obelidium mucronatum]|nr:hypothetical protein BDR26DRAFT_849395 [Obelidium mucronatum]
MAPPTTTRSQAQAQAITFPTLSTKPVKLQQSQKPEKKVVSGTIQVSSTATTSKKATAPSKAPKPAEPAASLEPLPFVYKGNFQLHVLNPETNERLEKVESSRWDFRGLVDGQVVRVEIELDPEEEKRLEARPAGTYGYKAKAVIKSGNTASELITKELKGLTREELLEKGDKYRELIEARELEDALYS